MNRRKARGDLKKPKLVRPDESFSYGPIQLARFGKQVVLRSNWEEGQHAAMLRRVGERYPLVVREIDELVAKIFATVGVLPPEMLLQRAWQEMVMAHRHVEAEIDVTQDDSLALRMVDYVQSVVAAAPRGEQQKNELTEADWAELRTNVSALYRKLNFEFPACATAHRKANGTDLGDAMEEFLVKSQMHWCNVRGNSFQIHQVDALGDLLSTQSPLIEDAYAISTNQLVEELRKIWHALTFGLHEAASSMLQVHREVMDEVGRVIEQEGTAAVGASFPDFVRVIAEGLGHGEAMRTGMSRLFGMDLFDVGLITDLPATFLDDFSWEPGQDQEFWADGDFKGWPLRIQSIFKRPFLKLNGRYYCFDLYGLFDNFYRQLEKKIYARSDAAKQSWIRNRKDVSEALPIKYFEQLLPGATVFRELYYPVQATPGGPKSWCEVDCVLAYGDHLFIMEVKAGAFTYTSPANDLPAYISSLKTLVESPSRQGQRFLSYLLSADEVQVFDSRHKPIGALRKGDYRVKTICAVTLDPFTEIAAQAQHLHKIGVDIGDVPVWPVSLSDLRVYSDLFSGPLDFLHYVEQRMRAAKSDKLELDDELDHLGLYLEHNNYVMHSDDLAKNGGRLQFSGYRANFDRYFAAKLGGQEKPTLPRQNVPERLRQLVDFLSASDIIKRSMIASYLLDLAGDWREDVCRWIDSELVEVRNRGRCLPMSTVGSVRLTVFINIEGVVELDHDVALEHARIGITTVDEPDRELLELTYRENGDLAQVRWTKVTTIGLPADEINRLKASAEKLKEKRLARSVADFGKLGRNDRCPCGSGKKFKHCCISSA